MATIQNTLSDIQSLPYFSLKLPISKIDIQFRQMMVKEEKIFLVLEDEKTIDKVNGLIQVLTACCKSDDDNFIVGDLSPADIECIIVNVRMKSIGATCKVSRTCKVCEHEYEYEFPLTQYDVINNNKEPKINFGEFGVVLSDISLKETEKLTNDKDNVSSNMDLIANSIKTIFTEDSVYSTSEYDYEDLLGFVDNLTRDQFAEISDFVIKQPSLIYNLKSKCPSCNKDDDFVIDSVTDFLD